MNNPTILDELSSDPHEFRVVPNRVDIWTVPIRTTQTVMQDLKPSLSCDEQERASRFHAEDHQHLFVVGRGLLRAILAPYVSSEPEALIFHYGSKGKPYLKNQPRVQFNLGHSGDRAVYALSSDELGVDIELVKPVRDWQKISERFFSATEVKELKMLEPAQQTAGFFACWTRKEAYLKATGEGLAAGLNKFYAGADPSPAEGTIHVDEESEPSKWYFKDLKVGDQFAAAVVTPFAKPDIRPFNFDRTEDCVRFLKHERKP